MTASISKIVINSPFPAGALAKSYEDIHALIGGHLRGRILAEHQPEKYVRKEQKIDESALETITRFNEELASLSIGFRDDFLDLYTIIFQRLSSGDLAVIVRADSNEECRLILDNISTNLNLQEAEIAAITEANSSPDLRVKSEVLKTELKVPDKVTLRWLWDHVTWSGWVSLTGLVSAAFGLGFWLKKIIG